MRKAKALYLNKIIFTSLVLALCVNIWIIILEANNNNNFSEQNISLKSASSENEKNFTRVWKSSIAKTGVAIATNLGLRLNKLEKMPDTIFKEFFSTKELVEGKQRAEEEIIFRHMFSIKAYKSLLSTDFKEKIANSENRQQTLLNIFNELKQKHENSQEQIKNLIKQKQILVWELSKIEALSTDVKKKISIDMKKADAQSVKEDINTYLSLKKNYDYTRTYTVFITNFIKNYEELNKYNTELLSLFSLNKDAILKGSYVVIPKEWPDILKEYNLLYSQKEFEEKNTEEE